MKISDTLNVQSLKEICKFLSIKNFSKLKKCDLNNIIDKHHAIIKLQRWIRKKLSSGEMCPISLEPIKFPCFAFKTKNNVLIYYNLDSLKKFLIKTGDFRDPMSRTIFSDEQLKKIDEIDKYSKNNKRKKEHIENNYADKDNEEIKGMPTSVYVASKRTKFYKKIKEKEKEISTLELVLGEICQDMKEYIENYRYNDIIFILNTSYLFDYRVQFRRLFIRSKKSAEYTIENNINTLKQNLIEKNNPMRQDAFEHVIFSLYQLREDMCY